MAPPIHPFFQKGPSSSSQFAPSSQFATQAVGGSRLGHPGVLGQSGAGLAHPPSMGVWQPQGTYDDVDISDLQPGQRKVRFMGRIVNCSLSGVTGPKGPMLPEGHHFLVVKDDTGLVAVGPPS